MIINVDDQRFILITGKVPSGHAVPKQKIFGQFGILIRYSDFKKIFPDLVALFADRPLKHIIRILLMTEDRKPA